MLGITLDSEVRSPLLDQYAHLHKIGTPALCIYELAFPESIPAN